ncbi:MAG: protein translocase subunit SecD [Clostridium tyrobutyricum]|jgi:preprotein translocase subunit SecD|uniref:protein translocase subunit SecD n=1 Tax=Clostridium tyrobutyricum TaxID=1519 RepID=UPI0011C75D8A|nr:protein translocase subunit SecD [Clostridium tyrobutyricum]MCH4199331.1 protein translocase subunit SecD [Clostridium tyrobutyricum]MCH4236824.1 protein translocase subunit SecD [Clostridium tyrobutyricum]MCH4258695.1 protein translocase subunit SecD [Clostridium tyrobutyricum]MCI1239586.1 protein translocase subunit SecD [Clostridium tyrobutyricum]MCI1652680.1 protein translocase subunit SecD [Clostridium tyrobutyricum]
MRSGRKSSTRVRSTIILLVCLAIIGFLAYSGVYGIKFAGYQVKPFTQVINRGLDLQGGISVLEEIQSKNVDQKTVNRTVDLLAMRVNKLGVSETVVTKEGNNRIRIEIPGKFDAKEVVDGVAKTGQLKFVGPDNSTILTGRDVKDASAYLDTNNDQQPTISLELNSSGTKKFADATQKFMGQKIAIYLDDQKLTDPTVNAHITDGKAIISGSQTLEEAQKQANLIKSGALPVSIKPVQVTTIGASLGANALPLSILAGKIGIGLVMIFMVLYYRLPGLIADIALTLYIYIVLAAFANVNVTLTLSGIAAFLLTVGMAVDANILIFERTKEELKSGRPIKAAINIGFKRAMSSIFDSNITSIISGIVLYSVGTGAVKGFALTLIIGVVLSMFTAITVTRTLMKLVADIGLFSHKATIGTFGVHDFRKGISK